MKTFKQHILEKLRINNSGNLEKEYKAKTNRVTPKNVFKYSQELLYVSNIDLFEDYWYHFLEYEDEALKENLDLHWDDIYLDYDGRDVYVLDNNTGDEICCSYNEKPLTFYKTYNKILEYFETKNE